mmetsp:Transcript_1293/g.2248  ORF Transcript_1293/g.2248 Transcript_1293/m.2248 type:complete len:218 (+) Transcript_1293:1614-2267(+)
MYRSSSDSVLLHSPRPHRMKSLDCSISSVGLGSIEGEGDGCIDGRSVISSSASLFFSATRYTDKTTVIVKNMKHVPHTIVFHFCAKYPRGSATTASASTTSSTKTAFVKYSPLVFRRRNGTILTMAFCMVEALLQVRPPRASASPALEILRVPSSPLSFWGFCASPAPSSIVPCPLCSPVFPSSVVRAVCLLLRALASLARRRADTRLNPRKKRRLS